MPPPRRADAHGCGGDEHGASSSKPRSIDSAELFGGADELQITHGEARYRLRRTLLGKLILTK